MRGGELRIFLCQCLEALRSLLLPGSLPESAPPVVPLFLMSAWSPCLRLPVSVPESAPPVVPCFSSLPGPHASPYQCPCLSQHPMCPSFPGFQPPAGLSSPHLFSLSSSAGSAISGSLESPIKRVGRAVLSCSVVSDSVTPWTVWSPPGSSVLGDSPGKNTGVSSLSLLQGIFLTQGSNPGLLHCRQILYHMSHQGSPQINTNV